jgi:RNA polymerase sigma-70 factor (ECF subfamily)
MTTSAHPAPHLEASFRQHERLVWGLAYRMTGCAADADDVVQDTFVRLVEHPPARPDEPLHPWLVRVAINLARDALRRRKVRAYTGPWLPSPVADEPLAVEAHEAADARYDLRESASYAFLVALEALTPAQRAVLLLRDVLDYSVRETAGALSMSEVNVKVIHHRARRAMAAYDRTRRPIGAETEAATLAALQRFFAALLSHDTNAAAACLADDVRLVSDGGGEYRAALRPVLGADRVMRFFFGLMKKLGVDDMQVAARAMNGMPALLVDYAQPRDRWAPRVIARCEVDARGAIREVHLVLATRKLTAIRSRP